MKNYYLAIFLFLSLNTFAQTANDKIKRLEKDLLHWDKLKQKKWSLKERMDLYEVNAVSIAVIKDYQIEWVKAYGYADVAEKRKTNPQTLFQAASISKSINSLAILRLVEDGKLNLNDDINNYLKTWKFPYDSLSNGHKITIAQLLSHQAGLSVSGFGGYEKGEELPTTIQILDGIKPANSPAVRSVFEPGLKFQYSGGGTTITQLILENTTGQHYEDFMEENILHTIRMTHSSFNQPPIPENQDVFATGYNSSQEVPGKYHIYPEKAAAGLWTNPTDLAKYLIDCQLSLLGKSNKVLSKEMSFKRLENNFGVFTTDFQGQKYFGHSGGNEGFVCYYVGSLEEGNGIVVMTNGRNMKLIQEIVNSIASLNQWKNYPLESSKESIVAAIQKDLKKNIDQGLAKYQYLKKNKPDEYNFSNEEELNQLGYSYLNNHQVESALKIFNLLVHEFPNSANPYDSRGEAYFANKEYLLSKKDYLKVLELEPANQNAKAMIQKIEDVLKK